MESSVEQYDVLREMEWRCCALFLSPPNHHRWASAADQLQLIQQPASFSPTHHHLKLIVSPSSLHGATLGDPPLVPVGLRSGRALDSPAGHILTVSLSLAMSLCLIYPHRL
jgi:hypothetical protein